MKNIHIIKSILIFSILFGLVTPPNHAYAQQNSPAEQLIGYVNAYRQSKGFGDLLLNSQLMASAQAQADYLAKTYNVDKGGDGSIGDRGTSPTDRAYQYGYAGWKQYEVVENWIALNKSYPLDKVVTNDWWRKEYQQKNFLDGWGTTYKDIGVGIAEQGPITFYIIDIGVVFSTDELVVVTNEAGETFTFSPVETAIPNEDGSVTHIVRESESLQLIALSYNVSMDSIISFNNLLPQANILYPGQALVIRKAYGDTSTGAVSITATGLPKPTATTAPTFTQRPPATRTPIPTESPVEASPTATLEPAGESQITLGMIGLGIVLVGIIGLIVTAFIYLRRRR
jgi:uncharacterized protein YkwD